MCDYSLMSIPNRLAVSGEELIVHRFEAESVGLASATDLRRTRECNGRCLGTGHKRDTNHLGRAFCLLVQNDRGRLTPAPIKSGKDRAFDRRKASFLDLPSEKCARYSYIFDWSDSYTFPTGIRGIVILPVHLRAGWGRVDGHGADHPRP